MKKIWLALCLLFVFSPVCFAELTINKDGTVTESVTGLMWMQSTSDSRMNWKEALSYCEGLSLAGYTDWRLPNQKELRSIVDYNKFDPAINILAFPGTMSENYWSSTTDALSTYHALYVGFGTGDSRRDDKSYTYYVRAVRGGQ